MSLKNYSVLDGILLLQEECAVKSPYPVKIILSLKGFVYTIIIINTLILRLPFNDIISLPYADKIFHP